MDPVVKAPNIILSSCEYISTAIKGIKKPTIPFVCFFSSNDFNGILHISFFNPTMYIALLRNVDIEFIKIYKSRSFSVFTHEKIKINVTRRTNALRITTILKFSIP